MREITCIAIDDEPLALTIIMNFCRRKGNINLRTFSEPRVGLNAIQETKPNLVFLDIEMNSINGLEIASVLPKECVLIFTTAHAQFALQGFNLNAVDFLHKPFNYERFNQAVEKAMVIIESKLKSKTDLTTIESISEKNSSENIIVKQEYNNVVIPIKDIIYIEAMENYTKIYRQNGTYVLSRMSMKSVERILPEKLFVRVHKSYIVPISGIESYSHNQLSLKYKSTIIPIGRTFYERFEEKVKI